MCLITKQKEPIILKEDLKVYKLLGYEIEPGVYNAWNPALTKTRYSEGQTYKSDIKESEPGSEAIFDGKAAEVVGLDDYGRMSDFMHETDYIAYGPGRHFATTLKRLQPLNLFTKNPVAECTIPAGAEVYYDKSGLGVTNIIRIDKILGNGLDNL